MPRVVPNQIYLSYVRPLMEYGGGLFANEDEKDLKLLDNMRPVHLKSVHFGQKPLVNFTLFKPAVEIPTNKLYCTHL